MGTVVWTAQIWKWLKHEESAGGGLLELTRNKVILTVDAWLDDVDTSYDGDFNYEIPLVQFFNGDGNTELDKF